MLKLIMICALQIPICAGALCPPEASVLRTALPLTQLSTSEKLSTESKTKKLEGSCSQSVQVQQTRTAQSSTSVGQKQGFLLHLRACVVHISDLSPWGSTVGSFIAVFLRCNFSSLFLTFFLRQ